MTAANTIVPRAFAVLWKDLHRWGVKSFRSSQWQWPPSVIKKLAFAMERKYDPVDKASFKLRPEHFLSIRFTGEVEPRDLHGKTEFKGGLFFANAGDLIYSKIDVRNGAIGIVPDDVPVATITSEFPIYRIKKDVALSEYIKLVFRTQHFRRIINGMVSGTSGRKRVQPEDMENVEIPLPPLTEQEAIVARWRKAQDEIAAAKKRIEKQESSLLQNTHRFLGMVDRRDFVLPKVFALEWTSLERWSVEFLGRQLLGLNANSAGTYPTFPLSVLCNGFSGGTPSTRRTDYWNGNIPWISPKDMKSAHIYDSQDHITQIAVDESVSLVPKHSVLLVVRSGILQRTVPVAVNQVAAAINQDIRAFVPKNRDQILPDYLAALLNSQQGALLQLVKWSTTVQSINKEELDRFPIPLPPLPIQRAIVTYVASGREEIAREQEAADRIARDINTEIEALILGVKKVKIP
jgi:type I restriction enzyme S subunit